MAPRTRAASPVQPPNLSDSAELAHLALLAGDVIEALPTSLTRSLSDLKELDAVLSGSLGSITGKLNRLLNLLSDAKATPQARLELLKEVAEDASAFKLGGDDKIRVATGTCETVCHLRLNTSTGSPPLILATDRAAYRPARLDHLFDDADDAATFTGGAPRFNVSFWLSTAVSLLCRYGIQSDDNKHTVP